MGRITVSGLLASHMMFQTRREMVSWERTHDDIDEIFIEQPESPDTLSPCPDPPTMFWIPFPLCFQCGTDQNPCRCKVVGPTLGMDVPRRFNCYD